MKFIISHDVDHLFWDDHLTDLIYPKLWVRETLRMITTKISPKEWFLRMLSPFERERHNINALMDFDKEYNVPSTFFFGMANGLGMSYKKEKAVPVIQKVVQNGFDAGVHGIAYDNADKINTEYASFKNINILENFGIREHYVRFNSDTFKLLAKAGYVFDTSEFDKQKSYLIKSPYKVGNMWEFPLTIMDGYLPYKFEDAKQTTLEILKEAENCSSKYICVLFHDYLFCSAYEETQRWYRWLIKYIFDNYCFISYRDAINELESGNAADNTVC